MECLERPIWTDYSKKELEKLRIGVPKEGMKEQIQAYAEAYGETANGFINRLICDALGVDKTTDTKSDL